MIKLILTLFCLIIINACSSSYEKLKDNNTNTSNIFNNNLLKMYKEKAIFEAEKMHDWNSAKLYSEKALNSLKGDNVKPQDIKYWKLPKSKIAELQISYDNLMSIYEKAKNVDPYNLAIAISSLDCWAEQQEENWQTWDINKCKDDFLNAMHIIYEKISKNEEKELSINTNENASVSDSVSLVTKNEKKEIMQIIYFDFDEAKLSTTSLKTIIKFLSKNKDKISNYIIVGHTDTKGTKNYNLELSLKRAETVKNILISEGVKEKNLRILGKGENSLAVKTDDEVKHPANRRVEIISPN